MNQPQINFGKALKYMEALLEGKNNKQAAHGAGLQNPRSAMIKEMFPLFLGLPRAYRKPTEGPDE